MSRAAKLELSLVAIGLCAVALAAAPAIEAKFAQTAYARAAQAHPPPHSSTALCSADPFCFLTETYGTSSSDRAGVVHVIGALTVPSLHLDVPLLSSVGADALSRGVGHVPGSAQAGGLGNLVVAGHRDTFFRPLRYVRPGMDVFVQSPNGSYLYRVDRTEVVSPDNLKVLELGSRPELTLVTCYPFNFLGSAPKRFIVHAHLVSLDSVPIPHG